MAWESGESRSIATLLLPADSPNNVTREGSPPNLGARLGLCRDSSLLEEALPDFYLGGGGQCNCSTDFVLQVNGLEGSLDLIQVKFADLFWFPPTSPVVPSTSASSYPPVDVVRDPCQRQCLVPHASIARHLLVTEAEEAQRSQAVVHCHYQHTSGEGGSGKLVYLYGKNKLSKIFILTNPKIQSQNNLNC